MPLEPPESRRGALVRGEMPQPLLHANDGFVQTRHPIVTRKRGAMVLLAAITAGAGMTAYGVYAATPQNCQQEPNDTKPTPTPAPAPTPCSHGSHTNSHFWFGDYWSSTRSTTTTWGSSRTAMTSGLSEPSVARGGFGAHGAMHASAAS
jgi:hypothetical protein